MWYGIRCCRVEVLLLLADVAGVAVLVPHLHHHIAASRPGSSISKAWNQFLRSTSHVGGSTITRPLGQCSEVMLDAAIAQRVVHVMFYRFAGQVRFRDEELRRRAACTLKGCLRSSIAPRLKSPAHCLRHRRLHHLAVARSRPGLVLLHVALLAGRGSSSAGVPNGMKTRRARQANTGCPLPDH